MEIKAKSVDLTAPTTKTLSLNEAIERTTNWRNFISNPTAAAVMQQIPKAVYISKSDIVGMYNALQTDESLVGARAYFTLDFDASLEKEKNIVTFCMVMVKQCEDKRCGEDIIYLTSNSNGAGDGDDDTGIYDYTKPCPDYCDPDSPLFNGDKP